MAGVAPRQFKSKLEEALTAKQESDAKVSTLEAKVKQYETELNEIKERVSCTVDYSNLLNFKEGTICVKLNYDLRGMYFKRFLTLYWCATSNSYTNVC